MLTMQPLMLMVGDPDESGCPTYTARFLDKGAEVEYIFTVSEGNIVSVRGEDSFLEATYCDPWVPAFYQSILSFHESRRSGA
ncbi:hypothetical protein BH11CYA1_BH11CYA1_06140 [soil metagenome]